MPNSGVEIHNCIQLLVVLALLFHCYSHTLPCIMSWTHFTQKKPKENPWPSSDDGIRSRHALLSAKVEANLGLTPSSAGECPRHRVKLLNSNFTILFMVLVIL